MFEVIGVVAVISLIAICVNQIGGSIINKSKGYETIDSKDDMNTDPELGDCGACTTMVLVEVDTNNLSPIEAIDNEAEHEIIKNDIPSTIVELDDFKDEELTVISPKDVVAYNVFESTEKEDRIVHWAL